MNDGLCSVIINHTRSQCNHSFNCNQSYSKEGQIYWLQLEDNNTHAMQCIDFRVYHIMQLFLPPFPHLYSNRNASVIDNHLQIYEYPTSLIHSSLYLSISRHKPYSDIIPG